MRFDFLSIIAYLCTTVSTVSALLASFFAGQQTFCFLQLQGRNGNEADKEVRQTHSSSDDNNNVDSSGVDDDELLSTVNTVYYVFYCHSLAVFHVVLVCRTL